MKETIESLVIHWLACREITDMREYAEALGAQGIPYTAKISLWSQALTKCWYKRTPRQLQVKYSIFLKCTKRFICPECFNRKNVLKYLDSKEKEDEKSEWSVSTSTKETEEEHDIEGDLDSMDTLDTLHSFDQTEDKSIDNVLSDDELRNIIKHLDSGFVELEIRKKTEVERLYLIRTSLYALVSSVGYAELIAHEAVSQNHLNKILGILVSGCSFLMGLDVESMFKMVYLLIFNLNGVFFTEIGQEFTKTDIDSWFLFIQNLSVLSHKRFLMLIDLISTFNQPTYAKFIQYVANKKIVVSSLKPELFAKWSKSSTKEIEEYKKEHPFSIPRLFFSSIIFSHKEEQNDPETLKEENLRLRHNITTLINDLRYFNTCKLIKCLKKELHEKNELLEKKK
ncbi:hypothetical protein NEOKW01_0192 [Nematocida sp. AWRm80]|nr:hypothetical protein NEOKW01_0192 [Nematocida sp. AWRm80]